MFVCPAAWWAAWSGIIDSGGRGHPSLVSQLPRHHVSRTRLVALLEESAVGVVEAGAGYGKSALAVELSMHLGIATAQSRLDGRMDDPAVALGVLRRAFTRAGLTDTAALTRAHGDGVESRLEALLDAIRSAADPMLLVIDDVHHAEGPAAASVRWLADRLPDGHRLLLLARHLPPTLSLLRERLDVAFLDSTTLAFDEDEVEAVASGLIGRRPTPAETGYLIRVGRGWPAATVLAAGRIARASDDSELALEQGPLALASLLDALLVDLDEPAREAVELLAHLPLLSQAAAEACVGPGSLELIFDAGLPLSRRDGWLELAEPVREELASRRLLAPETARRVARVYADGGELPSALSLLLRSGDHDGVAELLGERPWQELATLDTGELQASLGVLPAEVLARRPRALLRVAQVADADASRVLRARLLERAVQIAGAADGRLRREIEAEVARDRVRDGEVEEAERLARAVLEGATHEEIATRGRALTALGHCGAFRGDPASLVAAERHLAEAAALFGALGEREWRADALLRLGHGVCYARGDLDQATTYLRAALASVPAASHERATVATFLAAVDVYSGRLDDAEATLREAADIGRMLGDHRAQAYAAWTSARVAAVRGDAAATIERLREVERHPGDWFEHPTGIEFLADAAEMLALVGEEALARNYLDRATDRAEAIGYPEIAWGARGVVEARFGDAAEAERHLALYADSPQQPTHDEWRTLLLRAHAAYRCGEDSRAALLAARAFEAAANLGYPDLPFLHEPDLAPQLAGLAADAGSRAAAALIDRTPALNVTLLGEFGVSSDGRPLEVPSGRPSTLVKLVALERRPVSVDEAIEVLWPEVDPATGRQRLRNLLNRLRGRCGDLVVRDDESLVLAESARVDAGLFEEAASAALAAEAAERPALARAALARYAGELLPQDRYEAWATGHRERIRRRFLELLDLIADDAVERGEADEAIRLLDEAIATEPLDESRYLRCAELLLHQGRRGSARGLVERAAAVRARLGLPDTPRLTRLREATGLALTPRA